MGVVNFGWINCKFLDFFNIHFKKESSMTLTPEEIFKYCPELEPRYENHEEPGYMQGLSWIPKNIAESLAQARKERDVLKQALEEIAIYKEETNTECLADAKLATMMWRGCVAEAKRALASINKDSEHGQDSH